MNTSAPTALHAHQPSFVELFTPKLVTILREGYRLTDLRADAIAGLTVAIVALPLSMAIAIASGTTPDRGLYTAIVGGFVISALGGSRFQIGGPAGAFIVLVAATVARHGIEGLLLATMISGLILLAIGLLRLGTYIKFIPYPVTVGFTAGIAVIIFASQIKELLGLTLAGREPGEIIPKLAALAAALPTVNAAAVALAGSTRPRSRLGCSTSRSTPSRRAMAASPARCRSRPCRISRPSASWPFCPMPSPSPCSARSNRCCPRSSPTA